MDGGVFIVCFFEGFQVFFIGVGDCGYWYVYYVQYWYVIFYQGDIDGEFVVMFDEFFGVVEWVYQLEMWLVFVFFKGDVVGFFGEYWNFWGQCLQVCFDQVVGGVVGFGDWVVVVFVIYVYVVVIVDFKDGGVGVYGDGGYWVQQGV